MKTISDYTIYCTLEQTKKALELGAPIETRFDYDENNPIPFSKECVISFMEYAKIPTAEEMIGWLEEQGIMININYQLDGYCLISVMTEKEAIKTIIDGSIYRKTAIITAIDIALEYLNNKSK